MDGPATNVPSPCRRAMSCSRSSTSRAWRSVMSVTPKLRARPRWFGRGGAGAGGTRAPRRPILGWAAGAAQGPRPNGLLLWLLLRELPAERDQAVELALRGARVDRARRQLDALLEVAPLGACDERRRRVHEDDVALGPRLAPQDAADDLGVLLAVAAEQVVDRGPREAEGLGAPRERPPGPP